MDAGSTKDCEKRATGLDGEVMTADEISVQRMMLDVNNPSYDIRSPANFATTDYVVDLGASQVSSPPGGDCCREQPIYRKQQRNR